MLKVEIDDGMGEALLSLNRAESGTAAALHDGAAAAISAAWVPALSARASGAQQSKLLVSGAGADVDDLSFDLYAARGTGLSGGLDGSHWYAVDYGMSPKQITAPTRTVTRRLAGGSVVRTPARIWVGRNLPGRAASGRVVFPAIGEQSQDYVTAWVRALMEQFDGSSLDVTDGDELGQVSGSWR